MEWIPQYWHRSDMMGILSPVLDRWFSQRAGDWRTSSHHWCWNPSRWEFVSYLLYNHWSLLYSRNQWVIVLKTKTKEQSPKPKGFAVFSWPSMAAKVCVTVSLWSCGEFGSAFAGMYQQTKVVCWNEKRLLGAKVLGQSISNCLNCFTNSQETFFYRWCLGIFFFSIYLFISLPM